MPITSLAEKFQLGIVKLIETTVKPGCVLRTAKPVVGVVTLV